MRQSMANLNEMEAWANKLNSMTLEEIRELMQAEQCTGLPQLADRCVLSNFLTKKTGDRVSVAGHYYNASHNHHIDVSDTVQEFVYQFDNYKYPELVENLVED